MSNRRGVLISVDELIDEGTQRALAELETRRPELGEDEKNNIAKIIGVGAIRYYISRLSPEKHIVFKWDEALSFERGCALSSMPMHEHANYWKRLVNSVLL